MAASDEVNVKMLCYINNLVVSKMHRYCCIWMQYAYCLKPGVKIAVWCIVFVILHSERSKTLLQVGDQVCVITIYKRVMRLLNSTLQVIMRSNSSYKMQLMLKVLQQCSKCRQQLIRWLHALQIVCERRYCKFMSLWLSKNVNILDNLAVTNTLYLLLARRSSMSLVIVQCVLFFSTGWPNKNCTFYEIPYFCSQYRYNHNFFVEVLSRKQQATTLFETNVKYSLQTSRNLIPCKCQCQQSNN